MPSSCNAFAPGALFSCWIRCFAFASMMHVLASSIFNWLVLQSSVLNSSLFLLPQCSHYPTCPLSYFLSSTCHLVPCVLIQELAVCSHITHFSSSFSLSFSNFADLSLRELLLEGCIFFPDFAFDSAAWFCWFMTLASLFRHWFLIKSFCFWTVVFSTDLSGRAWDERQSTVIVWQVFGECVHLCADFNPILHVQQ